MADKAPYKLAFKFNSARPDAIGEALATLRELCGEYDQASEGTATIAIESWKEEPILATRNAFELWLHRYHIGLECEVTQKAPGLRPETVTALRAAKTTPMDGQGWEAEEEPERGPIIIGPPLALPAPTDEAELALEDSYTVEG